VIAAFKKVFMANLSFTPGPLISLLTAFGAISSLLLLGVLNLVH
jgi:hypothetical protein